MIPLSLMLPLFILVNSAMIPWYWSFRNSLLMINFSFFLWWLEDCWSFAFDESDSVDVDDEIVDDETEEETSKSSSSLLRSFGSILLPLLRGVADDERFFRFVGFSTVFTAFSSTGWAWSLSVLAD